MVFINGFQMIHIIYLCIGHSTLKTFIIDLQPCVLVGLTSNTIADVRSLFFSKCFINALACFFLFAGNVSGDNITGRCTTVWEGYAFLMFFCLRIFNSTSGGIVLILFDLGEGLLVDRGVSI